MEKDGNSTSSALRVLFEKDVTTLPANEVVIIAEAIKKN